MGQPKETSNTHVHSERQPRQPNRRTASNSHSHHRSLSCAPRVSVRDPFHQQVYHNTLIQPLSTRLPISGNLRDSQGTENEIIVSRVLAKPGEANSSYTTATYQHLMSRWIPPWLPLGFCLLLNALFLLASYLLLACCLLAYSTNMPKAINCHFDCFLAGTSRPRGATIHTQSAFLLGTL